MLRETKVQQGVGSMGVIQPLAPAALCRRCDAAQFAFETTAELEDLREIVGQARAVEAIRFGIGIRREGYNLLMLEPHGAGKAMQASLATILPKPTLAEALESPRIHNVAGLTSDRTALVTTRPFRAPHHTISDVGMPLEQDDHATGLIRLLSVGLRVLTLLESVVRQRLAAARAVLAGLYAWNPKRATARPTTERLLERFEGLTLTII
jgi:hypothetical protein